jgi:hypothetical protein
MKNLSVRLFVIGLFVASLALSFSSQTQAFSLPCNKVLKMTPQAWSDLYTKESNNMAGSSGFDLGRLQIEFQSGVAQK